MLARLLADGEFKVYPVTKDSTVAAQRKWPRLLHEGNWGGPIGVLINFATSFALLALLITGILMWSRRTWEIRQRTLLHCIRRLLCTTLKVRHVSFHGRYRGLT